MHFILKLANQFNLEKYQAKKHFVIGDFKKYNTHWYNTSEINTT